MLNGKTHRPRQLNGARARLTRFERLRRENAELRDQVVSLALRIDQLRDRSRASRSWAMPADHGETRNEP